MHATTVATGGRIVKRFPERGLLDLSNFAAVPTKPYLNGPLFGTSKNHELNGSFFGRLQCFEQNVRLPYRPACRLNDQITGFESRARCRAIVLNEANQQSFGVRQTDSPPHPPGYVRRRYAN